jgi:anoctamin-4
MIDTISDVSRSFESGFSVNLNGDRRPSTNTVSFDEHSIQSTHSKVGLLQRFTDIESMHPNLLERKFSYKGRRKKFNENQTIKEISPDSGQGDEDSVDIVHPNYAELGGSAGRRLSKQDAELREDPESLFFRDGRRKIDMILCYEEEYDGVMTEDAAKQIDHRRVFQENLTKEGLDIEIEDKNQSFDEKTYFVKIHLPWRTESRYAEVMNLKLPVKRFITISVKGWENGGEVAKNIRFLTKMYKIAKKHWHNLRILTEYDYSLIEKEPSFYSATSGGKPEEQFIVKDRMTHYNSAQRSLIVFQILLRAKYDDGEKCGIRRLLNDGTYLASFPLHEGRYDKAHPSGQVLDRRVSF